MTGPGKRLLALSIIAGALVWENAGPATLRASQGPPAQTPRTPPSNPSRSDDGIWDATTEDSIPDAARRNRVPIAGPYAVLRLNRAALDAQLVRAPHENDFARPAQDIVITLPLPDGRFSRFRIEESPILAPELQAAFPEIRTY